MNATSVSVSVSISNNDDDRVSYATPPLIKDWIKKTARNTSKSFNLNSLKLIIGLAWQNRLFVLEEGILSYYKGENDGTYPYGIDLKGSLKLKGIFLADRNHPDVKQNPNRLLLLSKQTYEKELSLQFDSIEKTEVWRNALEKHIQYSNDFYSDEVTYDSNNHHERIKSTVVESNIFHDKTTIKEEESNEDNNDHSTNDDHSVGNTSIETVIKTLPTVIQFCQLIDNLIKYLELFNNIQTNTCKNIMSKLQTRLLYISNEIAPVLEQKIYFIESIEMKFNQLNKYLIEAKELVKDCYEYLSSHDNGDCDPSKAINEIDIDVTNYINSIFQLSNLDKLLEHNDIYHDEDMIADTTLINEDNKKSVDDNLNDDDNNNLNEMNNLNTYRQDALNIYKQTLIIEMKLFGYEHLEIVSTLKKIANILKELNQNDEAIKIYYQLLNIQKKIYGNNHNVIVETLNRIANIYKEIDMIKEFDQIKNEVIEINNKIKRQSRMN